MNTLDADNAVFQVNHDLCFNFFSVETEKDFRLVIGCEHDKHV